MWKDIDIELTKRQDGDILDKEDVDAVKNSLTNIFSTFQGSRRMLPEFALPIYKFLFEPMDEDTAREIGYLLLDTIIRWEDRLIIDKIKVIANFDQQQYEVFLTFRLKNSDTTETFEDILKIQ